MSRKMERANFSVRPFVHDQIERTFFSFCYSFNGSYHSTKFRVVFARMVFPFQFENFILRDSDLAIGLRASDVDVPPTISIAMDYTRSLFVEDVTFFRGSFVYVDAVVVRFGRGNGSFSGVESEHFVFLYTRWFPFEVEIFGTLQENVEYRFMIVFIDILVNINFFSVAQAVNKQAYR